MRTKAKPRAARDVGRHSVSNQLRELISSRGVTAYALGKDAGVDPGVIQRFINRERDVRLETVDRLASTLGLRLVEVAKRGKGRPRKEREGDEETTATIAAAADDRQGTNAGPDPEEDIEAENQPTE